VEQKALQRIPKKRLLDCGTKEYNMSFDGDLIRKEYGTGHCYYYLDDNEFSYSYDHESLSIDLSGDLRSWEVLCLIDKGSLNFDDFVCSEAPDNKISLTLDELLKPHDLVQKLVKLTFRFKR
jgi:hypothetical protein